MNNMKNKTELKKEAAIQVYYDGLCKVCSREIDHYRNQRGADRIQFVDICSPSFNAVEEGLDPMRIHKVVHVRRQDGSLAVRVDAFIEIWSQLPKFRWLAKLASQKHIKAGLEIGYSSFILIRPFLPRYSSPADCQDSPYCEAKNA
jgi:predicted DCC family thiol-disulfide oxidoreductase YuxK